MPSDDSKTPDLVKAVETHVGNASGQGQPVPVATRPDSSVIRRAVVSPADFDWGRRARATSED